MSSRITEVLQGREENYILPFLWQHGEEEEMIREEMARVHESGIGAVCIEARPHPDFLGPKWWLDMDIIMDEARKRGMKVWLLDDDHFPTGHAAGKVKEAPEELHRKFLGERYVDTVGPAPGASLLVDTLLMTGLRPTISLRTNASGRNKLISVTAVRRDPVSGALLSESIDLTDRIQAGIVYWDIPEGYWRVFVISEDNQGGSEKQADYLNPLDRASVRILLDTVYEAIYERYKDDFGQTFAGFSRMNRAFTMTRRHLISNPVRAKPEYRSLGAVTCRLCWSRLWAGITATSCISSGMTRANNRTESVTAT